MFKKHIQIKVTRAYYTLLCVCSTQQQELIRASKSYCSSRKSEDQEALDSNFEGQVLEKHIHTRAP